jgi:hypothetical protein
LTLVLEENISVFDCWLGETELLRSSDGFFALRVIRISRNPEVAVLEQKFDVQVGPFPIGLI